MQRLAKNLLLLIFIITLSACVNFISAKGERMATIDVDNMDKVRTGMTEKEVVALFGPPQSFGVDDQGRHFIHFENFKISRTEGTFMIPFAGAISADTSVEGITVEVYFKDGIVEGTSKYFYQTSSQK